MAKTLRELEQEFGAASKLAEKTFNVLNGTGGRGGLEQEYEIAVRNKAKNDKDPGSIRNFSLAEFNALKARYDKAIQDYKAAQTAKNKSNSELKKFKKEAGAEKEKDTAIKVAQSAYDKAIEKLTSAEAKFAGYKGQENYITAYQEAKVAFDAATKAGAKPKALPKEKVAIPEVKVEEKELTPEEAAAQDAKNAVAFGEIKNQLADPKNKKLLTDVQKNLAKNFGYKGPANGVWSIDFQNALENAAEGRVSLPKSLQGKDLLTFIAAPSVDFKGDGGAGGKGTGELPITEYPTIFSPTDATMAINDVFEAVLGHAATAAEMKIFKPLLLDAQKKNPARYETRVVKGKKVVTQTTGLDVATFLTSELKKNPVIKLELDQRLQGKESLTLQDLTKTARSNGLDIAVFGDDINNWVKRINNGEDIDIFKNLIRKTAKIGLPDKVGALLDEGVNLDAVYAPYKNLMAKVLEVDAGSIKLDDPTLRAAIGPEKEMPIYEFERALRRDPRWQYTDTARQEVSDTALGVLKDFGFMG
jgi:hypothetical protein